MGIKDRVESSDRVESFGGKIKICSRIRGIGQPARSSSPSISERSESVADESTEGAAEDGDGPAGGPLEHIDSVQEADEESFPASDAPSSWAGEP
jgi:hypothetical protein